MFSIYRNIAGGGKKGEIMLGQARTFFQVVINTIRQSHVYFLIPNCANTPVSFGFAAASLFVLKIAESEAQTAS